MTTPHHPHAQGHARAGAGAHADTTAPAGTPRGWRGALLRFGDDGQALFDADGLLVTDGRRVLAAGAWQALRPQWPDAPVTHCAGRIIAPGFVDMHIHYPQTDVIGSPADGLLPWLEQYTFPHETRFADPAHAAHAARFFCDELLRNGVTTALAFATSHPASVDALMHEALARNLRLITGKVLQDRHSPDGLRDATEQSLLDTESLIGRWRGQGRLGYAITPRFAPTSSDAQLRGAGELAARHPDVWVQTHVAENLDEIAWVRQLFPAARSYLDVYARFGLLGPRSVLAHCIHLDGDDRALMRETGSAAAACPTSNLFLGSGWFDFAAAAQTPYRHGLASDVGGGTSFSPFATMRAAYFVGRAPASAHTLHGVPPKTATSLAPAHLWWLHSAGAAAALGLQGTVGNLQPGCEADFVVLNPCATPLLARRTAQAASLAELLFAFIVLGDDRAVARTVVSTAK